MGSRVCLLLLLSACARTTLRESVVDRHNDAGPVAEMDFWDGLGAQRAVTNHDALHALLLTFDRSSPPDFAGRVVTARARGWLAKDEAFEPNETVRAGWVASIVCLGTGADGSLSLRLFGVRERFALRELSARGWLPEMSANQAVSGMQLIALLGSVEDYRAGILDVPAEDL